MYDNIPQELRERAQWVGWRYVDRGGEKPTKVPYNAANGWPAESNNPATWGTYEAAVAIALTGQFDGIGFMLSVDDPYTFIDLDTYDPTLTAEDKARHGRIYEAFPGYAELSPSGKGLHLIVKGKTIDGKRRKGVEIYSWGRFMTMTGNVWRNDPIVECQSLITTLWTECGGDDKPQVNATLDTAQTIDDAAVIERGLRAFNGDKFKMLLEGQWQHEYPSQSEADFAFVDMLAFYTQNREQIKRIFRSTPLGQRDKAKRDDYFDSPRYGLFRKAFDNRPPEIDLTAVREMLDRQLAAYHAAQAVPAPVETPIAAPPAHDAQPPAPASGVYAAMPVSEAPRSAYTAPPGLVGEIARYIYASAPRPVPEIALCGAIGILAGITGRAYNVSGTGLNQYILLLANTGSGKEGMADGIGRLMTAVCRTVPGAAEFIGPGEIRSDAALLKYLAKRAPSFLTLTGEFSSYLQQMSSINAPSHLKGIKRVLLDLFSKSGKGRFLRQTIYSDAEKSTKEVLSPAFSLLGEGAPEEFYEALDERLIADGLLTRFTIFEYKGGQPELNSNRNCEPDESLTSRVAELCAYALQLNNANQAIDVQLDDAAHDLMTRFEDACRIQINSKGSTEVVRHVWNRAHLRSLKMAALIAVGQNPYQPVINYDAALWATELAYTNTLALLKKFERGEIGATSGDARQTSEVTRVIKEFMVRDSEYACKYSNDDKMPAFHAARVVPYVYINKRLSATSAFRLDRRGASSAMKVAISTLIDSGAIAEMNKQKVFDEFGSSQKCYVITNPNYFLRG